MPRWPADLSSEWASAGNAMPTTPATLCCIAQSTAGQRRIVVPGVFPVTLTHRTFAWAWLVVLCLVASSASGMIADRNIVWWLLGGVLAPATLVMVVARVMRPVPAAATAGDKG